MNEVYARECFRPRSKKPFVLFHLKTEKTTGQKFKSDLQTVRPTKSAFCLLQKSPQSTSDIAYTSGLSMQPAKQHSWSVKLVNECA